MLLWVLVVTVALAITNAQYYEDVEDDEDVKDDVEDDCIPEIEECCYEEQYGDILILSCEPPSGELTVHVDQSASYLKIICKERFTLVCDDLENAKKSLKKHEIDTSRKNNNLESLVIVGCNLPRESLACLLGVVGANRTSEVTLNEVEGNLKAFHLEGLEGITKFEIFNIFKGTAPAPYSALSHLPNLTSFYMTDGSLNLTSETGYVLSELKTFVLRGSTVAIRIPKGAFKSTPNIQMLKLLGLIDIIEVDAFEGLTKLVNLTISDSSLTHLPGGMFRHTPNIARLDLCNTHLHDLSDDLFTGLSKLEEILIKNNRPVLKLSNKTFSNLPSLSTLELNWCSIENIPADLFQDSTNLRKISLTYNKIKYIPNNTFKGLKLTYLDLEGNKISYLNRDVFSEQTSMTELKLSHNDLKSLPGELFSNMNSLKILDLEHNSIEYLNKSVFNGLRNLKQLSLRHNLLEYLDHAVFESTRSLEVLSLSNNKLTISKEKNVRKIIELPFTLDDDESASPIIAYHSPLKNLLMLRTLDLSHNNVVIICEDWTKMFDLTELDLSYNNITSPSIVDLKFPKNAIIRLQFNNIEGFELPINSKYTAEGTFLIDYNPYRCDCNLYYFIYNYKLGTKMFNINIEQAECAEPPALKGVKLVNLQPEKLTCDVDWKTGSIITHSSIDSNCNNICIRYVCV